MKNAELADTVSELVAALVGIDSTIASLHALRAELLNQANRVSGIESGTAAAERGMPQRSLRAELACALRIPERTAERLIAEGAALVQQLPDTHAALRAGEISYRHAQLLVNAAFILDADQTRALELIALPFARTLTPAKFDGRLRSLRESLAPESATDRHDRALAEREVSISPDRDGMASLSALLPAADALGIFDRITQLALAPDGASDSRSLGQRRADVFRDLLIDGEVESGQHGIRPRVFVTVPVLTLLGRSNTPATLDGYGPIDAETARDLAGRAPSFIRLLTHPETGAVLSVGRDSYRVPSDLKNWLRLRDGTCRFPGCSRAAGRTDIDHTDDWALGGETRHDNLAHLCRGHHSLKHKSEWSVRHSDANDDPPGTLQWTSPAGRRYDTRPEMLLTA